MKQIMDKVVKEISRKHRDRNRRARVLARSIAGRLNLSCDEVRELAERERSELLQWTSERLINEFVDYEELILRALADVMVNGKGEK